MPNMCPRYAKDMPKICPRYMPNICQRYNPRYSKNMPKILLKYAQDMPKIYPRYSQHMPKKCSEAKERLFLWDFSPYSVTGRILKLPMKQNVVNILWYFANSLKFQLQEKGSAKPSNMARETLHQQCIVLSYFLWICKIDCTPSHKHWAFQNMLQTLLIFGFRRGEAKGSEVGGGFLYTSYMILWNIRYKWLFVVEILDKILKYL